MLKQVITPFTILAITVIALTIHCLETYVYEPYLAFQVGNGYVTFSTNLYLITNGTHFAWVNWVLFGELIHFYNACTCDLANPVIVKDLYIGVKNCNVTIHQLYNDYKLIATVDAISGNIFEIVITGLGKPPIIVQLDNNTLTRVSGRDEYGKCVNCWFFDPINNLIFIKAHGSSHTLVIDYGRVEKPKPLKIELTYEKEDGEVRFRLFTILDQVPKIETTYVVSLICNDVIVDVREVSTTREFINLEFTKYFTEGTYTCYAKLDGFKSNEITFTITKPEEVKPIEIPKINYTTFAIAFLIIAIVVLAIVLAIRRKTGKTSGISLTISRFFNPLLRK